MQSAAKVRFPPLVSTDTNGPLRTFVPTAANVFFEPTVEIEAHVGI
jgi:hypothetical protein